MKLLQLTQVLAFLCFEVCSITPGQLGLRIDASLANSGKYVYNAIVQFQDDIQGTWSDEQIAGIAKQAHDDIIAAYSIDHNRYAQLKMSGATSVIVKGHSVYISSTLKGRGSYLYIPNANTKDSNLKYVPGNFNQAADAGTLEWGLMQCQVGSTSGAGHRAGGNCAEMMAAMAFVQTNPTDVLDNSPVVAWGDTRAQDSQGRLIGPEFKGVMNPCNPTKVVAGARQYGCTQVSAKLGLRAILKGTTAQDTVLSYNPTISHPCFN